MTAAPPPGPPAAVAPLAPGRVDYRCADGRRVLVLYRRLDAVVRIERYAPVVLTRTAEAPDVWRSDAYDGGPFILTRGPADAALVSPGWPDTTCRP